MLVLLTETYRLFRVTRCSDKGYSNLSKCKPLNFSLANSISTQFSLHGCQDVACPLPCASLRGGMAVG